MHVYMACMYIWHAYMYVCMHAYTCMHASTCMRVCTYILMCMCVCLYVNMCHAWVCTPAFVCVCACMHACMCVCEHVNVNTVNDQLSPRGAYLSKRVLGAGAYSRGGLIPEWGLNQSFTACAYVCPSICDNSNKWMIMTFVLHYLSLYIQLFLFLSAIVHEHLLFVEHIFSQLFHQHLKLHPTHDRKANNMKQTCLHDINQNKQTKNYTLLY